MLSTIEYAPVWIIMAVALALGIGTMIGWRRVATTIGEKIGKKGMTYAQGMSAQMTAAVSIGLASYTGMPVSTTHVLSSSVAGTMVVDGGGLQRKTVTSILDGLGCLPFRLRYCFPAGCTGSPCNSCNRTHQNERVSWPASDCDIVRFVHAGCGVNALSGLQKHANSIDCRDYVG